MQLAEVIMNFEKFVTFWPSVRGAKMAPAQKYAGFCFESIKATVHG